MSKTSMSEGFHGPKWDLCRVQPGSPFWRSWHSRSHGYKRDILSTFMSELWLNSWHALSKLLLSRVNKLTSCWIFTFKISTLDDQCPFIRLASLLHATLIKKIVILMMIPQTNFEKFDDSVYEFWRMIVQVQHYLRR